MEVRHNSERLCPARLSYCIQVFVGHAERLWGLGKPCGGGDIYCNRVPPCRQLAWVPRGLTEETRPLASTYHSVNQISARRNIHHAVRISQIGRSNKCRCGQQCATAAAAYHEVVLSLRPHRPIRRGSHPISVLCDRTADLHLFRYNA